MKTMQPIARMSVPKEDKYLYEIKYDGYRALMHITESNVQLTSRNRNDLSKSFPELIEAGKMLQSTGKSVLPILLDGEIVILNNPYQGNFSLIQKRGRLQNSASISKAAEERPAHFLAFDLLQIQGNALQKSPYLQRKQQLADLFLTNDTSQSLRYVKGYNDVETVWEKVFRAKGEGIVAKRKNSAYIGGKAHYDWFKQKNWRTIHCFFIQYEPKNGYFTVAVYDIDTIYTVGKCKHGLDKEEVNVLKQLFVSKGIKYNEKYTLPPAICASVHTLSLHKGELREPEFFKLLPNEVPENCTVERLKIDMAMLPPTVQIANEDKLFWPQTSITKGDLLIYMRNVSMYMLPFLRDRALTVIRAPNGVSEETFYQKNIPSYALAEIRKAHQQHMVCNSLEALIWFANHGAIEYHIPFQTMDSVYPNEIVFDLDPPNREKFTLAVQAAQLIKRLLNELDLISFVKTSGNKGLQVHIPIRQGNITYEEAAVLTKAIATTLEKEYPTRFTTERLKKNRKNILYIDYVQHGKNKTIIAPYSPRKTEEATVATPLFWSEVHADLSPELFTMETVVQRIHSQGCPFATYFPTGKKQQMNQLLQLVKK